MLLGRLAFRNILRQRRRSLLTALMMVGGFVLSSISLGISDGTVKLHVKAILRKLNIHSRVEAAVIAVEHGLRASKK